MKLDCWDDVAALIERDVRVVCFDGEVFEGYLDDVYLDPEDYEYYGEPAISGIWDRRYHPDGRPLSQYPAVSIPGSEIKTIELLEDSKS